MSIIQCCSGEEGTVSDAVRSLTTHEIHARGNRFEERDVSAKTNTQGGVALRESKGAEVKLQCNIGAFCKSDECSSLKGIRCPNKHFTCDDCFSPHVANICDDALSKGCLAVKCAECIFVFGSTCGSRDISQV